MAHYRTINHAKKFIAFFSPKCGSTTVKEWFIDSLEHDGPMEHAALTQYMIPACDVENYPNYRKIFFIRNPFQRLVSFYCGFVVRETPLWCFADDEGHNRLEGKTFAEMVSILAALAHRGKAFQHHLQPQLQGIEGVQFDSVLPIESFDTEIGALSRQLGINYDPKRLNATRYQKEGTDYSYDRAPDEIKQQGIPGSEFFYNEALLDTVSSLFREDIKYYELHASDPPQEAG